MNRHLGLVYQIICARSHFLLELRFKSVKRKVKQVCIRLAGRSSASDEATVGDTEIRVWNKLAQESKDERATYVGPLSQVHSD